MCVFRQPLHIDFLLVKYLTLGVEGEVDGFGLVDGQGDFLLEARFRLLSLDPSGLFNLLIDHFLPLLFPFLDHSSQNAEVFLL